LKHLGRIFSQLHEHSSALRFHRGIIYVCRAGMTAMAWRLAAHFSVKYKRYL